MTESAELLSLEQAADVLKVGVPTIRSLIDRGLLATEPGAEPPLVPTAALLAFLRADQRALLDEGGQPPTDA
ncbi:MAG TPA: helix-turn-helix domain-containing protein [Herpetosiphonaceae bacterium]